MGAGAELKAIPWEGRILYDAEPVERSMLDEVCEGLAATPRIVPPKFLYDARGFQLFEAITELPEYYPTRTELGILQGPCLSEVAALVGPGMRVVEFGSGSGLKTELLLQALPELAGYVPIDISVEALRLCCERMAAAFPALLLQPLRADYSQGYRLPPAPDEAQGTLAFFPGSTLGNFTYEEAEAFLAHVGRLVGSGGRLLLGTDMVKPAEILVPAYCDAQGVTEEFIRNLLPILQRELDAELEPEAFGFEAEFNVAESRVELWLRTRRDTAIGVGAQRFELATGEGILAEYSYKYERSVVQEMAAAAGFAIEAEWTDSQGWFGVWLLRQE